MTLVWVVPMVGAPLGIQCGLWALRNDAYESVTDPLTGAAEPARAASAHQWICRCATTSPPIAEVDVMVIDLDRFKDINDAFGHPIGDEVLVRSARRIKAACPWQRTGRAPSGR